MASCAFLCPELFKFPIGSHLENDRNAKNANDFVKGQKGVLFLFVVGILFHNDSKR